jgi:3'-phosphoadenosine 5'-phosphosulfate sulfotransferase (PAPS reductase)/FAD synthetase
VENTKRPHCNAIGFWRTQDVWDLINLCNLPHCDIYKEPGIDRTGCSGCMYGVTKMERFDKFKYLARKHPRWFKMYWETCGLKHHFKLILGVDYPPWIWDNEYKELRDLLKLEEKQ